MSLPLVFQVDQLLIKQKVELVEGRVCQHAAATLLHISFPRRLAAPFSRAPFPRAALVGFESNNKYEVRNTVGQNVFYAVEENDCLSRQCCGPMRSFNIHVLDNYGQEVITVTRPLKCMSCCFPCCLQEVGGAPLRSPPLRPPCVIDNSAIGPLIALCRRPPCQLEVQSPPGNTVGYVTQQWHPFSPKFIVANEHLEPVLKIHGPFCGWSCLPDVDFEVGSSPSGAIQTFLSKGR